MSYVHLTTSERVKIETYPELGFSARKIAGRLGRQTFGHWELDTVVSGRGKSKGCVATFVERKSRFYLAVPMEDRSAQSMESAIQALHLYFPLETFQTATTDRGKEFSCHERIRDTLGVPMYFADPYSSW